MLHIKLIMNTVHLYIENALKEPEVYQRDILRNIYGKLRGYTIFHKFNEQEHKILMELGNHEYMEKLKKTEVDFSVYAMSLLQELINDVPKQKRFINISDKKILQYKADMIKDMLRLKSRETTYDNVKEIVEQSRMTAKQFYHYTKENL